MATGPVSIYDLISDGDEKGIVKALQEGKADPNEKDPFDGEPVLRLCALKGMKDAVIALIDNGADVNYMDDEPDTARDFYSATSMLKTIYIRCGKETAKYARDKGAIDNSTDEDRCANVKFDPSMLDD